MHDISMYPYGCETMDLANRTMEQKKTGYETVLHGRRIALWIDSDDIFDVRRTDEFEEDIFTEQSIFRMNPLEIKEIAQHKEHNLCVYCRRKQKKLCSQKPCGFVYKCY